MAALRICKKYRLQSDKLDKFIFNPLDMALIRNDKRYLIFNMILDQIQDKQKLYTQFFDRNLDYFSENFF